MDILKKIWEQKYIYFLNYGGGLGILALGIFMDAGEYKEYGEKGWMLLCIIMLISPLAGVFPKVKIFTKLKGLRKPLGIIAGAFMLAHSVGYFVHYAGVDSPIKMLSSEYFWSLKSGFLWGTLAAIISFALFITSNEFSVKFLGKNWKHLHRLGHFLFVFVILHIIFITGNMLPIGAFSLYLILHILTFLKIKF